MQPAHPQKHSIRNESAASEKNSVSPKRHSASRFHLGLLKHTPPAVRLNANSGQTHFADLGPIQPKRIATPAGDQHEQSPDPAERQTSIKDENRAIRTNENNTGLPDNLKTGVENLSGLSMDEVKVHYDSPKPAQLQALAYTQGSDIHVAPRQEKHLPHEAWHVVQQKQGRVKPTMQMKDGVPVNDDKGLEREADVMGGKAVQTKTARYPLHLQAVSSGTPVQRKIKTSTGAITTLQDLINTIGEPYRSSITGQRNILFRLIPLLDADELIALDVVYDVIISHGFRYHWREGICNGTIEFGPERNWADLHVTGAIGASLDNQVLAKILEWIYEVMCKVQQTTRLEGVLEWHPTGAVVTKQVVSLLANACGKLGVSKLKGKAMYFKRKHIDKPVERNKLAPKIDVDLLPEYFSFLESLQGVAGIRIVPVGISLPPGVRDMREHEQVAEIERSMIDATDRGKLRLATYKKEYTESEPEMAPSLRVYVNARHIPAMIKAVPL